MPPELPPPHEFAQTAANKIRLAKNGRETVWLEYLNNFFTRFSRSKQLGPDGCLVRFDVRRHRKAISVIVQRTGQ